MDITSSDNAARVEELTIENTLLERQVARLEAEAGVYKAEFYFEMQKLLRKILSGDVRNWRDEYFKHVRALQKTCRRVSAAIKDIDDPRLDQAKRDLGKVLSGEYGKDPAED